MPDAAYYGIVGEFVRAVEPLTEADPAGVLACVLTGIGSGYGRAVHHRIGRRHAGNLFVLLVGNTSARKGTCWDVAHTLLSTASPEWAAGCVENGFGSGEGFVYRIRDASEHDDGVPDKRLLVVEEEWAKPLRLCRSEKSILSPLIRAAFDGSPLSVLNKAENGYGRREPHVSIVGMITPDELRELVKGRTELVNGGINRFLLVDCQRRNYLPTGGGYYGVANRFAPQLTAALRAMSVKPYTLDADASLLWNAEKPKRGDCGTKPSGLGQTTRRDARNGFAVSVPSDAGRRSPKSADLVTKTPSVCYSVHRFAPAATPGANGGKRLRFQGGTCGRSPSWPAWWCWPGSGGCTTGGCRSSLLRLRSGRRCGRHNPPRPRIWRTRRVFA